MATLIVTLDKQISPETVDRISREVAAAADAFVKANAAQIEAGPLSISQLCQQAFCEGAAEAIARLVVINAEERGRDQ